MFMIMITHKNIVLCFSLLRTAFLSSYKNVILAFFTFCFSLYIVAVSELVQTNTKR